MTRKLLLALSVALVAMGASATVASALTGATATLTVTEAHKVGGCLVGQQQVDATADLTITNNTGGPITLASAAYAVNGHNGVSNAPFTSTATLTGGGTLPGTVNNNATATINGITLTTLVPCDVNDAQLCVTVSALNPTATLDEACSTLISGGSPVPVGTIGGIAFAALLGLGLVAAPLVTRRRRTRRSVTPIGGV